MTDPERLLRDGDAEIVSLLRSAEGDGPSEADRRAIAAAIGIGVTGVAVTAAAHGTLGKLGAMSIAKIGGAVALVFSLGVVTGVSVERRRETKVAAVPQKEPVHLEVAPPPLATAIPTEAVISEPSAAPSVVPTPRASATSAPVTAASLLAEETVLLGRAKKAIASRAFGEAIAALDAYDVVAPAGVLLQESRALRVQALAEQGSRLAAIERGRAFLEAFPTSPHAKRVRAIVDALEAP